MTPGRDADRDPAPDAVASPGALAATYDWFERHSGWAPPDPETLDDWRAEGGGRAPDECWVEPERGTCPHGLASWLVVLEDLARLDAGAVGPGVPGRRVGSVDGRMAASHAGGAHAAVPPGRTSMDVAELHRRAVAQFIDRVAVVADHQWDQPTPCSEWTVRDLVNHVVGEERWTVPLLAGRTIEDVGSSLDGDLLGDAPRDAATAAAVEASASVDARVPEGGKVALSYGPEDVDEYVRQLSADHLIHAWDLAAATGGSLQFDPLVVAEVGEWFAEREDLYRSVGVIGPRVEASSAGDEGGDPDQRAFDDLLAASGRDPRWTPPA
jgi:uncharacterized protein (TIGR03086 family)